MSESAPRGTLGTVHNAATLLGILSNGPSHHQLTELAERSDMSLPTVHRLLRSLVAAGLVEQDPASSRYGLGPELVRLAEHYLMRLPVLKVSAPYMVELRQRTKATVGIAVLIGDEAIYVDRIDGDDSGGVYRNAARIHHPLDSAAGRVLVANADDATWEAITASATGPDERELWRAGDYVVLGPNPAIGQMEAAAPLRDGPGDVRAAIAISVSSSKVPAEQLESDLVPHLVLAARTISRALGHG